MMAQFQTQGLISLDRHRHLILDNDYFGDIGHRSPLQKVQANRFARVGDILSAPDLENLEVAQV
jgi:hypothetical protein